MRKYNNKLIVIALPLLSEGEMLLVQGARKSLASLNKKFEMMVLSGGYEASLRTLADLGTIAGAIGEFMSPIWLENLITKGIPVVQLGAGREGKIPSASTDMEAMGHEAVKILLENGVHSLAYLGTSGPSGSARLWKSFSESCRLQGYQATSSSEFSGPILKEFIVSLPLPTGLLCATDRLARLAIQTAQELKLKIPQDIAVIGVGNSRMESLHAGIAISSFELPLYEIGLNAGTLLADWMIGKQNSVFSRQVKAILHERDSSIRSASGIARAMAYLRSNPSTSMSAGELARFAGMSRRSFENAMLAEYGRPPGIILKEMRQARAEKLLRESKRSIAEIASECGYQEPSVFSTAFKRWTGKSPRDYRRIYQMNELPRIRLDR